MKNKLSTLTLLAATCMSGLAVSAQALDIPMTAIGGAGNAADTVEQWDGTTGYGKVDYNYNIGTSAVTNAQYAVFLNSVAKSDPYGLYKTEMSGCFGGITRSGEAGNYTYTATRPDAPVNYVSFYDAARFCNWLTNGAVAGADTEVGMYTLADGGIGMTRNADAWAAGGYAITSEDEWYKAAYYNVDGGYYTKFATGDTITQDQAHYWVNNSDKNVDNTSDVGDYPFEQNGTLSMMGDVWEWNEGVLYSQYGDARGLRGGSFSSDERGLDSSARGYINPEFGDYDFGFRVSSLGAIPEPSTYAAIFGALVLGFVAVHRRRRVAKA